MDYAAKVMEDASGDSLFCEPIYCILCNKFVSEEVKECARAEMKKENDRKAEKDASFVPRTWDQTTDATRSSVLRKED